MTENRDNKSRPALNLPPVNLRLSREDNVLRVYDALRRKFVALTPEEYVRQHFVSWLQTELHFPPSLMANEIGINVNGTHKRCDTVIFGRDGAPLVIVEYKAPDVAITQHVFDQVVRYNMCLHAKYLIVSNGMSHYCCAIDYATDSYHFIPKIPDYRDLVLPINLN